MLQRHYEELLATTPTVCKVKRTATKETITSSVTDGLKSIYYNSEGADQICLGLYFVKEINNLFY